MEVLNYLKTHSLEDLTEEFGIKVRFYPECSLAVLNYSQIDSPKYHPIVQECRGLIIDMSTLKVVSRTFSRFYNLNENVNDEFNFNSSFRAEEKADGSLISVYWFNNEWNIATRGTAFGEATTASGITFKGIFESIIGMDINEFMIDMFRNQTYTFEMCSIYNKVVKVYNNHCVYLLAINIDGYELSSQTTDFVAITLDVLRPMVYNIGSVDEAVGMFKDFDASEEGFVLIDENGNRIKVKNPAYVDLHHMKGNGEITPKRITDVVFRGETEEILSYFPEYREFFEPWHDSYDLLIKTIDMWWYKLKDSDMTQKEFALTIKDYHFKGILFSLRNGLMIQESFDKIGALGKVSLLEFWIKK